MLKQTPIIAIFTAALITIAIITFIEDPVRPFTIPQTILVYIASLLPSFGIALLFDPFSAKKRDKYLNINFYEEKQQ